MGIREGTYSAGAKTSMSQKQHRYAEKLWEITDKGDQDARILADYHYSRQTPGATMFTRNGQNLVFITEDLLATWVTFRPTPGKATRQDGLDAWECALFRNVGPHLSSRLIREAVSLSLSIWGPAPPDGIITYVKEDAVQTDLKGYCYRRAGWRRVGYSSDGKPMFRAPRADFIEDLESWCFHEDRGGKLRIAIESGTHSWSSDM